MKKSLIKLAAAAVLLGGWSLNASAAACTIVGGATAGGATTADYTYRGSDADACVVVKDNDEQGMTVFGVQWDQLVKFDFSSSATPGTVWSSTAYTVAPGKTVTFGIEYEGLIGGFYRFNLLTDDTPDTVLPGLMDLLGVTKQGNEFGAWLFEEALIGDSGNAGAFKIAYGPNGGNQFSHFAIYGRKATYEECEPNDPRCGENEIPEPGTLALAGLALAGLALRRRRQA